MGIAAQETGTLLLIVDLVVLDASDAPKFLVTSIEVKEPVVCFCGV